MIPTLSDGTAGGVEAETITLPLVSEWVDEFVTVSEQEIMESLGQFKSCRSISKVDFRHGFHHIEVHEDSRKHLGFYFV